MKMKYLLAGAVGAVLFGASAQAQVVNLSGTDSTQATQSVSLAAGTYSVSLINNLSNGGYEAVAVAQNPDKSFTNQYIDYYKYSTSGPSNYTFFNPFAPSATRFATADAAFAAYSAQPQLQFTLAAATTVYFQIGDSLGSLGDNAGGTSLLIAAVPEPGTWAMMIVGFGLAGYGLRRRRTQATPQLA